MKITELFERGEFVVSAEVGQKEYILNICWKKRKLI